MKYYKIILVILVLIFSTEITGQNVYVTNTDKQYHTIKCNYLNSSKIEITLKKAASLGYLACQLCKPTISKKRITTTSKTGSKKISSTKKRKATVQCTGTTKTGIRCKQRTKNTSGRCYEHK